jgi:uncharacterized membrane protein YeiH
MAAPFTIPLWADILAVAIGSLQGAIFAAGFRDRRLDLLGVAIIGTASGLGGGLLRDVFVNVTPAALSNNWLLLAAVGAALAGMLLERIFVRLDTVITVLDALTIGLCGSVVRDMLLNLPIALMHVGSLYAVAALVGTATLVLAVSADVPIEAAASIGVGVTTVIRILAVRFGWSLPEQRALGPLRFPVRRLPLWHFPARRR